VTKLGRPLQRGRGIAELNAQVREGAHHAHHGIAPNGLWIARPSRKLELNDEHEPEIEVIVWASQDDDAEALYALRDQQKMASALKSALAQKERRHSPVPAEN
jgi:hypothetical protein